MKSKLHGVIGLGVTGVSSARFLKKQGIPFILADSRENPPSLQQLQKEFPDISLRLGKFTQDSFDDCSTLVVSPGISLKEPSIAKQISLGKTILGDIELFAQTAQAPIIAITGTNAKSTVTTLVAEMAKKAGIKVQVGGNLGTPALDLLTPHAELYVLELSSFQLETTHTLSPQVAAILNVTPDHMDRYQDFEEYCLAKFRIYSDCVVAVCNKEDKNTDCGDHYQERKFYFTLNTPAKDEFGLLESQNQIFLAFEETPLLPVSELPLLGKHSQANALAALAIGYGYGLPFEPMLEALKEFKGLPHRCQLVRDRNGVRWYNDSKGTNVGASLAAIEGLGSEISGKLVLILGGVGKNADFSLLTPSIEKYAKMVILLGEAALNISDAIGSKVQTEFAKSMEEAIFMADHHATFSDSVLLSPACASFDMFKNFEHRGNVFSELVLQLSST